MTRIWLKSDSESRQDLLGQIAFQAGCRGFESRLPLQTTHRSPNMTFWLLTTIAKFLIITDAIDLNGGERDLIKNI